MFILKGFCCRASTAWRCFIFSALSISVPSLLSRAFYFYNVSLFSYLGIFCICSWRYGALYVYPLAPVTTIFSNTVFHKLRTLHSQSGQLTLYQFQHIVVRNCHDTNPRSPDSHSLPEPNLLPLLDSFYLYPRLSNRSTPCNLPKPSAPCAAPRPTNAARTATAVSIARGNAKKTTGRFISYFVTSFQSFRPLPMIQPDELFFSPMMVRVLNSFGFQPECTKQRMSMIHQAKV